MPKVTPQKIDLFTEEIQSGAAASEATMQRVAASVNFWNTYFDGNRSWFLNGKYDLLGAPQVGVDGAYPAITDVEIYGFAMFNLVAGISGETELDLQVLPPTGSPFSLFTVRPKINYQAGNSARMIVNVSSNTVLAQSTFTTLPVFSQTTIEAGSLVTLNLTGAQVSAESCGLVLALRPVLL